MKITITTLALLLLSFCALGQEDLLTEESQDVQTCAEVNDSITSTSISIRACELEGLSDLEKNLVYQELKALSEKIVKGLSVEEVESLLDSSPAFKGGYIELIIREGKNY